LTIPELAKISSHSSERMYICGGDDAAVEEYMIMTDDLNEVHVIRLLPSACTTDILTK
jgi:hypothetical protein